ncbi:hypothetical protein BOX15_Mlig012753g1 [Macrostomum lignano]|uniref:EF-hand domain-containing protein n=1 Tax=Macrostomum lignano TaxID=282301 RepID=A0A267GIA5_9PLAT|nr:hypothetical protein BOX15_Mlig012753g1 [Macrostomum lignano]
MLGWPQQDPQFYQQQQQQMQHANPNSQHYGSYGQNMTQNVHGQANPWQSFQFNSEDEFIGMFQHYASQSLGGIQAEELCRILNEHPSIRNYYRVTWSLELCKIMLAMLDRSRDGVMQYAEFRELLTCLLYWHRTFQEYDRDRSGFIEANELHNIISSRFLYRLSAKSMTMLLKRYSKAMDDGRCLVAFDDFVTLSVRLRTYTEAFRARDRMQHNGETGTCQFSYDDFLQCTMSL